MRFGPKLPATLLLLTPLAAHAHGAPHIVYAMAGGFIGGLAGSFLACWLCSRMRRPKDETNLKTY